MNRDVRRLVSTTIAVLLSFTPTFAQVADYSEAQTGCPVTYSYSRAAGRELLEQHGLEVTDIFVDHIFAYEIPEYVQYRYKKVWYYRWMPDFLFRALERAFGWHLCLTAKPR